MRHVGVVLVLVGTLALEAGAETRTYLRPHKAPLLQEQLQAAGIPAVVESDGGQRLRITVPDAQAAAAEAIVLAHNPGLPSSLEAREAARLAAELALRTRTETAHVAIQGENLPTPAQVAAMVDALFPDPTYTDAQRTFFRRVVRALLFLIQERGFDQP